MLPFMLALYVGGVELGDGMVIQVKVTDAAHTVADMTTQQTKNISKATMTDILGASRRRSLPFCSPSSSSPCEDTLDHNSGAATVTWSDSNGTPRPVRQAHRLCRPRWPGGSRLLAGNDALLLGEVSYAYTPNRVTRSPARSRLRTANCCFRLVDDLVRRLLIVRGRDIIADYRPSICLTSCWAVART